MGELVLTVDNLTTGFIVGAGIKKAAANVSFQVKQGEVLGLAGESGCGKSVTSLSIMRLLPPGGRIMSGSVILKGANLLALSEAEMRRIRGGRVAMVFQEPMTSLNPVFAIGKQLMEVFNVHADMGGHRAREAAISLLDRVGLPDSARRFDDYPHQMSGGMRQRVMIAMALAGNPDILIADEPTTALDVTIQAQILQLIDDLRLELGMGTILISHDLGVIAEVADRTAVMYAGEIVEYSKTSEVFEAPYHPYTEGLLRSLPARQPKSGGPLTVIPGNVPDLSCLPPGCAFEPRCSRKIEMCRLMPPPMEVKRNGQMARCWVPP